MALVIWFVLTLNQTPQQKLLFPSPLALWKILLKNFSSILSFSIVTWYRVIVGLMIGSCIGFFSAILMTWSEIINKILDPFIELIRPVPPIALTPFFILWFGLGDLGQLFLISLGSFMVIVVYTVVAIRNVSPVFIRASKSLGANALDVYRTVFVPAIIPNLQSGLRVASGTAFGLTVAAEYLGAQGGLGYLIRNARMILQTDAILLAVILLGTESIITDKLIRAIFGYLIRWAPKLKENN